MTLYRKLKPEHTALLLFSGATFYFCRQPLMADVHHIVRALEFLQEIWLLFCINITALSLKGYNKENNEFIMWSISWWLLLYGRSLSWGRVYFPEMPYAIYRLVSIVLIASVFLPLLLSTRLRKQIAGKVKTVNVSLCAMTLVFASFGIADCIEHHRLPAQLFTSAVFPAELAEELYEAIFLVGLFFVSQDILLSYDKG